MPTARAEFLGGVRAELPILVGTIPFGLIYGVSAVSAGLPRQLAQAMSFIVFAGSAQFVAAQFIGASVPGLIIVVTAFVINLRHALYSASIAPHVRHLPARWKWLLAYLLTDEAYAVAITHYTRPGDAARKHWYFLGAGLALWTAWQASTAVGIFLGAQVPANWSLDFTLPLTFIALVVPTLRDRAGVTAALVAGVAAVLCAALPVKSGLLLASAAGIVAGLAMESPRGPGARPAPGAVPERASATRHDPAEGMRP
jgi:4-azaleucine resistance transporter AzlC